MSSGENSNTARAEVVNYLSNEIWGPSLDLPADAKPLPAPDADGIIRFEGDEQDVKYFDPETRELLIQGIRPQVLYGTGVLHSPRASESDDEIDEPESDFEKDVILPEIRVANHVDDGGEDGEESFALDQSQKIKPSAFGMTFRAKGDPECLLNIEFSGAIYSPVTVQFAGYGKTTWYKRQRVLATSQISLGQLAANTDSLVPLPSLGGSNAEHIALIARSRSGMNSNDGVFSTTIVAKHSGSGKKAEDVFQVQIRVTIDGNGHFDGQIETLENDDPELAELDFLYRHVKNFATGHGIAVEWDAPNALGQVFDLRTVAIPKFYQEVLSFNAAGGTFKMKELAEMSSGDLKLKLMEIPQAYREWLVSQEAIVQNECPSNLAAKGLVSKARKILQRMEQGIETLFLPENSKMLEAFKLANEAMYLQQKHGRRKRRPWPKYMKGKNNAISFGPVEEGDPSTYGQWRQFQIGFLLLAVNGLLDPKHEDRLEVDLIFFPTGGGKTEAYLGASALTIIYRRLTNDEGISGVDVLMRYTLRLLTIQQFERSSGLIVALEHMRRKSPDSLGAKPISIGVWLGAATTANSREDVKDDFNKALKNKYEDSNPFVLTRCPWCGAGFGKDKDRNQWIGYELLGTPKTLRFRCPDSSCEFSDDEKPLPIWITDEDVYTEKPSFILATVDKFARMAWKPDARALFNLNSDGDRVGPPPALIIQDELHLISGPLGSMVGLYEPVIEELCTDDRFDPPHKPKIIASTATTRKYESQIYALYGREGITLFPQAVTRANETFFSSVAREDDGSAKKGTLYLGVNPATYETGQMAASVIGAVLLQAPNQRDETDKEMDYYRTSMWFFNSLRELGMTLTLMQSVVLDRIRGMSLYRRLPADSKPRWPSFIMELTSRVPSNQIASSLSELSINAWEKGSVSTCLASSIMEVGVDVGRLGLLTIMSQPKSTAQYIQVSGRVGRDAKGPGIVVMLYNAQRARDRSVYERFNVYHSRLYAQVESVSVTPFSIPAMRHGLVGALLSYYRMTSRSDILPNVIDENVFEEAAQVLRRRLLNLTDDALKIQDFDSQVHKLKKHWERYQPDRWNYSPDEEKGKIPDNPAPALMRGRREPLLDYHQDESILVPSSLRSVDGQTELKISHNPYSFASEGED